MEKGKVDMELIRRYIRGELTPREMYALERQAQADPMLMDIILGMEQETSDVHNANLADIRERITERSGQRRVAIRRLAPAQRWAIAASILAVLTVGTWWFTRDDTTEQQREATIAAAPEEVRPDAAKEAAPPPEPVPLIAEREADAAPQRAPTAAPSAGEPAAAAEQEERKEERLAVVTPKADRDEGPLDSVVVVGYSGQKRSVLTGAASRMAAADTPVRVNEEVLAGRTNNIRIRGVGPTPTGNRLSLSDTGATERPGDPAPQDGWPAYRQYLKNAVKLAPGKGGTVVLSFTVDDSGRPAAVAVVETSDVALNKFAALIVRDGPRWAPGANNERDVTLRVEF